MASPGQKPWRNGCVGCGGYAFIRWLTTICHNRNQWAEMEINIFKSFFWFREWASREARGIKPQKIWLTEVSACGCILEWARYHSEISLVLLLDRGSALSPWSTLWALLFWLPYISHYYLGGSFRGRLHAPVPLSLLFLLFGLHVCWGLAQNKTWAGLLSVRVQIPCYTVKETCAFLVCKNAPLFPSCPLSAWKSLRLGNPTRGIFWTPSDVGFSADYDVPHINKHPVYVDLS